MKFFIPAVLTVLLPIFLTAQEPAPIPQTASAPTPLSNSLLWEITGPGLDKPSYLYGTIHLIDAADFFLTEETKSALSAAEQVYFEIDIEEMDDMGSQFSMLMGIFMDRNTRLRDLLSAEDYQLVSTHFESMDMPMFMVERIKPLFLTIMASEDMTAQDMASGEVVSYEMELLDLAKEQKKPVEGLETMEFQLSLFDSIPYDAQAKMLVEAIQSTDSGQNEFAEMVNVYKAQDIEAMASLAVDPASGMQDYETLLLAKRNENWIPIIEAQAKKKTTFFAVGAGHLGGPRGVIRLLEQRGYTLKPLHAQP